MKLERIQFKNDSNLQLTERERSIHTKHIPGCSVKYWCDLKKENNEFDLKNRQYIRNRIKCAK